MEKRKILAIGVALFCMVMVIVGFTSVQALNSFDGVKIKNPDAYTIDFTKMNGVDGHTMHMMPGDELAVDFDIRQGIVDVTIGLDDNILYRGNRIDTASFKLPIDTEGDYRIEMKAQRARGSMSFAVQPAK